jgi:hypothetical protein
LLWPSSFRMSCGSMYTRSPLTLVRRTHGTSSWMISNFLFQTQKGKARFGVSGFALQAKKNWAAFFVHHQLYFFLFVDMLKRQKVGPLNNATRGKGNNCGKEPLQALLNKATMHRSPPV